LGTGADNLFGNRPPTSHELRAGESWDSSYHRGPPPWDFGGPQPAVIRLAAEGGFVGPVLDVGCGSGENALHLAGLGLTVLGTDVAVTALALARTKAAQRGLPAEFAAADALHLERLGRTFRTVLDSGLFHTFDRTEQSLYARSLSAAAARGAVLYLLAFGDTGPDQDPHPVSQVDLQTAFRAELGWKVTAIASDRLMTRFHPNGAAAWLARVERV